MKLFKNGFLLLLIISLVGTVLFYSIKESVQIKLNERIQYSLELTREAQELFADGEYAEAKELLLESLALNKLNPHTYTCLAFVELNLGNYQQAYEYFVSTLNMNATSVEIIQSLAQILLESGHYDEAEKYLSYGLQDYPENETLLDLLDQVRNADIPVHTTK
ncbi:MAG: tetratricopeptide repeat protein [Firmicutes bacterium]|nr:tetratricopeptide repeat protein [Bacillota bacterium]